MEAKINIDRISDDLVAAFNDGYQQGLSDAKPKWILATERLPEEPYGCLAIVWDNPRYGGGDMFLNYYPEYIGWDGKHWNDAEGEEIPLDVVYWMKMPQIPPEEDIPMEYFESG